MLFPNIVFVPSVTLLDLGVDGAVCVVEESKCWVTPDAYELAMSRLASMGYLVLELESPSDPDSPPMAATATFLHTGKCISCDEVIPPRDIWGPTSCQVCLEPNPLRTPVPEMLDIYLR
jgi:hypothetical protein